MSNDAKVITGLTLLAIAVIGGLVWLAGRNSSSDRYLPAAVEQAAESGEEQFAVGELVNDSDYQDGSATAAVTLVELADFECPVCRVTYPVVHGLRDVFTTDELRLVYRHVPLWEIHAEALSASRAAQAAHRQGRFAEYASALYENQSRLGEALYKEVAEQLALDLTVFDADRSSDEVAWQAARARDYMESRGWSLATPTIVINNELYEGPRTTEALSAAIRAAM